MEIFQRRSVVLRFGGVIGNRLGFPVENDGKTLVRIVPSAAEFIVYAVSAPVGVDSRFGLRPVNYIEFKIIRVSVQLYGNHVIRIVRVDQRWVPNDPGTSLYIRPFLYSTDPTLALHGVHEASFVIILSPSGSYFSDGLKPVPIMVETEDVRAVRGGTGEAKCGGNYGAANRAGERAEAKGYSQVLWLDGVERKYVEEGGGMNVMFKINGTVVTPALTGSILRGVTRKSAIELLKSWGVPVEERLLSVDELFDAAASGALEEAWCIGTAAVICPIGELTYEGKAYTINNFQTGPLAQKLYDTLTGIQWGTQPDPHGWTCKV